jgi:hypothetical protein
MTAPTALEIRNESRRLVSKFAGGTPNNFPARNSEIFKFE